MERGLLWLLLAGESAASRAGKVDADWEEAGGCRNGLILPEAPRAPVPQASRLTTPALDLTATRLASLLLMRLSPLVLREDARKNELRAAGIGKLRVRPLDQRYRPLALCDRRYSIGRYFKHA